MRMNKKHLILSILIIGLCFIGIIACYLSTYKKSDGNDSTSIIDERKAKIGSDKKLVSAKIVGDLATKEQLIAMIDGKKILIYHANGEQLDQITNIKSVDADHDGKKEIFISVDTRRNDFSREIFFILKKEKSTYKVLKLKYPKGTSKEGFDIAAKLNDDMSSISIFTSVSKNTYTVPVKEHYKENVMIENGESIYAAFKEMNPKPNEVIGVQTNMSNFQFVSENKKDYIVAEQYVMGLFGPPDLIGKVHITFYVKKDGKISVKEFQFENINKLAW